MSEQADKLVAAKKDLAEGKISAADLTEMVVGSGWDDIAEAVERTGGAEAWTRKSGR
jgi:hypothetical protein